MAERSLSHWPMWGWYYPTEGSCSTTCSSMSPVEKRKKERKEHISQGYRHAAEIRATHPLPLSLRSASVYHRHRGEPLQEYHGHQSQWAIGTLSWDNGQPDFSNLDICLNPLVLYLHFTISLTSKYIQ